MPSGDTYQLILNLQSQHNLTLGANNSLNQSVSKSISESSPRIPVVFSITHRKPSQIIRINRRSISQIYRNVQKKASLKKAPTSVWLSPVRFRQVHTSRMFKVISAMIAAREILWFLLDTAIPSQQPYSINCLSPYATFYLVSYTLRLVNN